VTRPVDERLVRQRSRHVAGQVAAVVAVAMLVVVGLATLVVVRSQQAATDRLLRSTARTADDVGDPPAGAWIVLVRGGRESVSPGLPEGLAAALAGHRSGDGFFALAADEREFRAVTLHRGTEVAQVVVDLRSQHEERDRLLKVMGAAAAVSLAVAGGVGAVMGRAAVRPLAEALALQRSFVADASHELRTPLALLSTRVQVLERQLPADVPAQVREDVAGVRGDVQRLGEVVDDLLVAATPEIDERRSDVDLRLLVGDALASVRAHATERRVALGQDDDGELVVHAAEPALRRAVLALLDNALDHSPVGGQVHVSTRRERGEAVLQVADTGPGLTAEAAAHVFERFHSGGQRAGRAHYGLGLALTHEVVLRHGGRMSVVPAADGAVFEIRLPLPARSQAAPRTGGQRGG
jgi:signal transduction histidine kinase